MAKERLTADIIGNHRAFLSFVRKRVGSDEEAEEILQSAYAKGLRHLRGVRKEEGAVPWFFRILRNSLVDHYRRRAVESRALAQYAYENPAMKPRDEEALEKTVCACVKKLIKTAKPEYADIIEQVELGDVPVKEYARRAGVSANNATVRVHRARRNLKKRLLETCGACARHGCIDCSCKH